MLDCDWSSDVCSSDLYNYVVVNAGLKSEAYIPIEEFKNDQGEVETQVGDFVSVAIDAIENGYGDTILSRDKAKRLASWLSLENALESGDFVNGTVSGKVKGGLTVLVNGIRAFLPGSLIDTRPVKDLTPYEGKTMEFKVIKLDRKRNNVVLSRRAVIEASMGEERAKLLETLTEGAIVHGVVKNITEYGAFVDLGGIDGLLHITDMAWRRVRHPSEVVTVGQELSAKVLKFDAEKNRVSLGIKQLGIRGPWGTAEDDALARSIGGTLATAPQIETRGIGHVMAEIREKIGDHPTYLSFDIDAVDPAFAPGTGTPVPGGLTSREALALVRGLAGVRLVGMDLVEVLPALDHADMTVNLGAYLLFEGLAVLALRPPRR
jgi:predicted RNA-binding protein with RPS1 domain